MCEPCHVLYKFRLKMCNYSACWKLLIKPFKQDQCNDVLRCWGTCCYFAGALTKMNRTNHCNAKVLTMPQLLNGKVVPIKLFPSQRHTLYPIINICLNAIMPLCSIFSPTSATIKRNLPSSLSRGRQLKSTKEYGHIHWSIYCSVSCAPVIWRFCNLFVCH